jgi:hydroxymethylpyrimidine pyrophosphatase-like HAD family hydrolase
MKAFCTDLDGTLRDPATGIHPDNLAALEEAGRRGVLRVVVTGRSLHHSRKVLPLDTPIDWLVFASGAGHLRWPDGEPDTCPGLSVAQVERALERLEALPLSYSIHEAAPHSHRFRYRHHPADGTDFLLRLERNTDHGRPLDGIPLDLAFPEGVSQLLVFAPPGAGWPERLTQTHPELRVLHSTSPLDGRSAWIELQPREVSKSAGAARLLTDQLGIPAGAVRALGNDHNDRDLLEWAGDAAVVDNAPDELRRRHRVVPACAVGGAAAALRAWLGES